MREIAKETIELAAGGDRGHKRDNGVTAELGACVIADGQMFAHANISRPRGKFFQHRRR